MKTLLFLATIGMLIGAIVFSDRAFFVLFLIFLIFTVLEIGQSRREKELRDWYREIKERKVNDIEDWHEMDYKDELTNKN